jgi:hypothetical protein
MRALTVADITAAMLPRPWRVVRDTGSAYIVDATGERIGSADPRPEAVVPMQLLVDLANNHPEATLAQILHAGLQAILDGE